jgi:hypothetical protein
MSSRCLCTESPSRTGHSLKELRTEFLFVLNAVGPASERDWPVPILEKRFFMNEVSATENGSVNGAAMLAGGKEVTVKYRDGFERKWCWCGICR